MSEEQNAEHALHSKVFVGNLPFKTTNADLEALFCPYGDIIGVSIRKDRMTNKPKGFGFVSFAHPDCGPNAIAGLHGVSLQGRPLTVSAADKRGTMAGEGGDDDADGVAGARLKKDTSWKTVPSLPPSAAAAAGGKTKPQGSKDGGGGKEGKGGEGGEGPKSWGSWAGPPKAKKPE